MAHAGGNDEFSLLNERNFGHRLLRYGAKRFYSVKKIELFMCRSCI